MDESAMGWTGIEVVDLGRMSYESALARQRDEHARVLGSRESGGGGGDGVVLLVEHDPPVITVSRRASASGHLLASGGWLAARGIEVAETDRGGDITYHGPGQLVAYPIVDLRRLHLNLHAYMRLLESAAIDACAAWGVEGVRDADATGVWVRSPAGTRVDGASVPSSLDGRGAKVCALGVRVRRWVTMHGLALNVRTDLSHFDAIVPCGLAGRGVTSIAREVGVARAPTMEEARVVVGGALRRLLERAGRDAGGGRG